MENKPWATEPGFTWSTPPPSTRSSLSTPSSQKKPLPPVKPQAGASAPLKPPTLHSELLTCQGPNPFNKPFLPFQPSPDHKEPEPFHAPAQWEAHLDDAVMPEPLPKSPTIPSYFCPFLLSSPVGPCIKPGTLMGPPLISEPPNHSPTPSPSPLTPFQ